MDGSVGNGPMLERFPCSCNPWMATAVTKQAYWLPLALSRGSCEQRMGRRACMRLITKCTAREISSN